MLFRKIAHLFSFFILILLINSGSAIATSASITVSGNEGAIPLNASASFTTYTTCDSNEPPNCTDHNSGTLSIYQDDSLIRSVSGNGSASWSTILDDGYISRGEYAFNATTVDYNNTSHSPSTTIIMDNTPEVTLKNPGLVEGSFNFEGTVVFKENFGGEQRRKNRAYIFRKLL